MVSEKTSVRRNRWDETPRTERETPAHSGWAETPRTDRVGGDSMPETPGASKRRSRWDETPSNQVAGTPGTMTPGAMSSMTPATPITPHASATPLMTPSGVTPTGHKAMIMATPTPGESCKFSTKLNR